MKKTTLLLMLVILSTASQAQINPKMSELFRRLTELDAVPSIVKSGGGANPTRLRYSSNLYYSPDRYLGVDILVLDSLLKEDKRKLKEQVAAIRHTLDELQEVAQESFHYENHKVGKDTIYYSMNLSQDSTRVYKFQEGSRTYYNSDEFLDFHLEPFVHEGSVAGSLIYTVSVPQTSSRHEPYTREMMIVDIDRLFKEHRIKPRKALWQHDEAYSDSAWRCGNNEPVWGSKFCLDGTTCSGVTEATIYTVPHGQKQLANEMLESIDNLAQRYTNSPQELYYQYNYGVSFRAFPYEILFCLDEYSPTVNYSIQAREDGFGYHFLVAYTKGNQWIPRSWPSVKYVTNEEITYFKGMKPKEDK